jgi:hypothetical protein
VEHPEDTLQKTMTPEYPTVPTWEILDRASNKQRPLLVDHQGHRYNPKGTGKKSQTWRCHAHNTAKCKATVRQFPIRPYYQQIDFELKQHAPGISHFDRPKFGTEWEARMMREAKDRAVKNLTKSVAAIMAKSLWYNNLSRYSEIKLL